MADISPDLTRQSLAGTAFHYRWAARRCLQMINPSAPVRMITVEGSINRNQAGEYVIDLAEYGKPTKAGEAVTYYQLKHSTVRIDEEFSLKDATKTLKGFAGRFRGVTNTDDISFKLITNRQVSQKLRDNLQLIRDGKKPKPGFLKSLLKSTKLRGAKLQAFCLRLSFIGDQGDYIAQKRMLRGEMAVCIAGFNEDSPEIESLIAMVADRALPKSENSKRHLGEIHPEDVLQRLGATSGLFPAPPSFGEVRNVFEREGHAALVKTVTKHSGTTIIHAEGGVGKTIVAQQLTKSLPPGSAAVLYDCFGSGSYRNASSPRHRPCDGLVQMANELAAAGYSDILIGNSQSPKDALYRKFIERLNVAAESLKQIDPGALLVLIIDAGDNAEMEADDQGDPGFIRPLFSEKLPDSCRLVVLARTERLNYLKAPSTARLHLLTPFSLAESTRHLRSVFPQATDQEAEQFHRLTSRNPRIQANALAGGNALPAILQALGPSPTTLDGQIGKQLREAIDRVRDASPTIAKANVDAICTGLATLPPMVPLKVLAAAAKVSVATIKSLVSDVGRPLWHSDDSVQFLDEPTETWFRKTFSAKPPQLKAFAKTLEPLAGEFTYVAKSFPKLLLQAGNLKKLVDLALSDELLPEGKPIDERDVRVYRLRFAFRAALKLGRRADAMRLAFRAGEEAAGTDRQFNILSNNLDLIAPLQDSQRVQELALNRMFRSGWQGSETVYTAALLSSVPDFKGEATSFLDSAHRWLLNFFEFRKTQPKSDHPTDDLLTNDDVLELVWAHYNLEGATAAAKQLLRWRPPNLVFDVARKLAGRIIDAGRFADLDLMATVGAKNPWFMTALAEETGCAMHLLPAESLEAALDALLARKTRIPKGVEAPSRRPYVFAIVSFAEACAARALAPKKILSLLRYYTSPVADRSVGDDTTGGPRETFVRALTLRSVLQGNLNPDIDKIVLPLKDSAQKPDRHDQRIAQEIRETVAILLPWYLLRARLICRDPGLQNVDLEAVHQQTRVARHKRQPRTYDRMAFEATIGWFRVLTLKPDTTTKDFTLFSREAITKADRKFWLSDRLEALHTANRLPHLRTLAEELERSCLVTIEMPGSTPEDDARYYIKMARALLPVSIADAAVYFGNAVTAVSKFGDEKQDRWEAFVAVAARAAQKPTTGAEKTVYRFLRCGEMVEADVTRDQFENRGNVLSVAFHLHPCATMAALSRWRDRAVGHFPDQLRTVAHEGTNLGLIKASAAWSLTGFVGCRNSGTLAAVCIRKANTSVERERLFRSACADFALDGADLREWKQLAEVAKEVGIDPKPAVDMAAKLQGPSPAPHRYESNQEDDENAKKYAGFIQGKDPTHLKDLELILGQFNKDPFPRSPQTLWNTIIDAVPRGKERAFLLALPMLPNIDYIDAGNAITSVRAKWNQRAVVRQEWPNFIKAIGRRFAIRFSNHYRFYGWLEMNAIDDQALKSLKIGLLEGYSDSSESMNAEAFFGFVRYAAEDLSPDDAHVVLDYALERFEKHMEPLLGDGPWDCWLKAPPSLPEALAGFLWSALGSPYGIIRWQAAHCVRRLAANRCVQELQALIRWMHKGTTDAFGGNMLPYYALHSRLYLIIAFSRIAHEHPQSLVAFAKDIAAVALGSLPHVLIQTIAAKTAITIEAARPGTFSRQLLGKLERVGVSPFAIVEEDPRKPASRQHKHGIKSIKAADRMHFGIDFEPYWFKYLGNVFSLSEEEITDLVSTVAQKDLKIVKTDGYRIDPRFRQWQNLHSHRRSTSHSHGSYPFIDDHSFYIAYHSLMSVAARLVVTMPTTRYYGDRDEPWPDWLRGHMLTRRDGRWLADRRDPTPLKQRDWTDKQVVTNWRWNLKREDFLDVLWKHEPPTHPVCVNGHWVEMRDGYTEKIVITSALVDPAHSHAIASELRSCFHHERQPLGPFDAPSEDWSDGKVMGWIRSPWSDPKLDQFDPIARQIKFPPCRVTKDVAASLGLVSDSEGRHWSRAGKVELIDQIWSDEDIIYEEHSYRWGERMLASPQFLKRLCMSLAMDLVVKVEISRNLPRYPHYSSEENGGYIPSSHNLFVLSASGDLDDGRSRHKI
jgi:hypothetical protein